MQESYSYGLSDGLSPARKGDGLESSYHNNNTQNNNNTHSNNNNIHNDSTSHNNNNNNNTHSNNNNNNNNNKGDQHRNNYDKGPGLGPGQPVLISGDELGNDNNDNNNDSNDSMHGDDDEGGIIRPQGQGQSHLPGHPPDDDHPNIDMDMGVPPEAEDREGEGEVEEGENMNGEEFDIEDWDDDLRFPDSWSSYVDSPNDSNPPQEGRYKQMK